LKLSNIKGSAVLNSSGDEIGTVSYYRFKDGLDYMEISDKNKGKDIGAVIKSHDDNGNIIISPVSSIKGDLKVMFIK
jgi:sporulation protein YlmC with PRC-barrel domain